MSKIPTYLLLGVMCMLLSCGNLVSIFTDCFDMVGYGTLFLLLAIETLFILGLIYVNLEFAVPRLLFNNRFAAYCEYVLVLSFILPVAGLGLEYAVRSHLGIPLRITEYHSPWIFVDSFASCLLMFLLMLGTGAFTLYDKWKEEDEAEEKVSRSLRQYMSEVRGRLNPDFIFAQIDRIIDTLRYSAETANRQIVKLCTYLRQQLYELPAPAADINTTSAAGSLRTADIIISKRYRKWRHVLFQLILATISAGVFFTTPDKPEFTSEGIFGFFGLYILLNAITYADIRWLFPRFRERRSLLRHIIELAGLCAAIIIPLIIIQMATYEPEPYTKALPTAVKVISTFGSMATLLLFAGGVSDILFMQDWLSGERRMTILRAEYARQEYAFLRKQINPHFLFNVLNNAGILSEEDIKASREMLCELKRMLEYQFDETEGMTTPLEREIEFLRSYLTLEATRMEPFNFSISAKGIIGETNVPTLIFITFVENAVKHSSVIDGRREVTVSFSTTGEGIVFRCRNTFRPGQRHERKEGGIGLANTCRRIELLYGDKAVFSQHVESNDFIIELFIPYNDELHNSR